MVPHSLFVSSDRHVDRALDLLTLIVGGIAALGMGFRLGTASLLVAIVVCPAVAAMLGHPAAEVAGLSGIVLLILIAHRANIRAFFAGRRGRKGPQA